jgi:pimeloyl-ACP methyl ester carboxylesterase
LKVFHLKGGMRTFVLVPGAWLGGWVWKKVVPLLEDKGHQAFAVTLTGEGERVHLASKDVGMETAIQDVLNIIEYNELDDLVVVGHSFAGKVAAAVADRVHEKVSALLYLDAFRPAKDVRTPQGSLLPNEFGPLQPGQWSVPLTRAIVDTIGSDVQGKDREWLFSKATPWPLNHATQPISLSKNFDTIKTAFVFCTGSGDPVDEILNEKWGKIDGPYKLIDSGHWPMITKPDELVEDMIALTEN